MRFITKKRGEESFKTARVFIIWVIPLSFFIVLIKTIRKQNVIIIQPGMLGKR